MDYGIEIWKYKMEDGRQHTHQKHAHSVQFSSVQKNEELLIRGRGLAVLP